MITVYDRTFKKAGVIIYHRCKVLADNFLKTENGVLQSVLRTEDDNYPYVLFTQQASEGVKPFVMTITQDEAKAKMKSWGMSEAEITKALSQV